MDVEEIPFELLIQGARNQLENITTVEQMNAMRYLFDHQFFHDGGAMDHNFDNILVHKYRDAYEISVQYMFSLRLNLADNVLSYIKNNHICIRGDDILFNVQRFRHPQPHIDVISICQNACLSYTHEDAEEINAIEIHTPLYCGAYHIELDFHPNLPYGLYYMEEQANLTLNFDDHTLIIDGDHTFLPLYIAPPAPGPKPPGRNQLLCKFDTEGFMWGEVYEPIDECNIQLHVNRHIIYITTEDNRVICAFYVSRNQGEPFMKQYAMQPEQSIRYVEEDGSMSILILHHNEIVPPGLALLA